MKRYYSNSSNSTTSSTGIGFTGLLTIAFIVLKLIGIIDWHWLWVLSPLWISACLVVAILLLMFVVYLIKYIVKEKRKKAKYRGKQSAE